MPLSDYPPLVRPFRVIDERLLYHSDPDETGRLLSGLKYDFEGKLAGRGVKDFPYIQPVAFSDVETIGPGANHPTTGGASTAGSSPAWDEQTFAFWVFARRENGFYRRNPADSLVKLGVMDWVARIRDAVEIKADGTLDRRLEDTCATNVQSIVSQNEVTDIGWGVLLEFIVRTDTYCPGGRWEVTPE